MIVPQNTLCLLQFEYQELVELEGVSLETINNFTIYNSPCQGFPQLGCVLCAVD